MAEKLIRPQTVAEFQAMFHHVYGEANGGYSDQELIWRMIEEMTVVGEIARKNICDMSVFGMLSTQVARTCSWWFRVTSRFGWDLQEMLWNKYPGICPYCLRPENCVCPNEHPKALEALLWKEYPIECPYLLRREVCRCNVDHPHDPKEMMGQVLRTARRERGREPRTFAEHQALHRTLYLGQNMQKHPTQIALHLLEEAGEVSKANRKKKIEERHAKLQDELPDVASWMFAMMNRHGLDLADALWKQYPYECERCHNTVCDCSEDDTV